MWDTLTNVKELEMQWWREILLERNKRRYIPFTGGPKQKEEDRGKIWKVNDADLIFVILCNFFSPLG